MLEERPSTDMDEPVTLSDNLSLGRSARAWGSKKHNSRRSPRVVGSEPDPEHPSEVVSDIVRSFINGVVLIDETFEGASHTFDVQVVFINRLISNFFKFRAIQSGVVLNKSILNLSDGGGSLDIQ